MTMGSMAAALPANKSEDVSAERKKPIVTNSPSLFLIVECVLYAEFFPFVLFIVVGEGYREY